MKHTYDMVRQWLPDATDSECRNILETTDYPFCSLERLEHQVKMEALEYRHERVMRG